MKDNPSSYVPDFSLLVARIENAAWDLRTESPDETALAALLYQASDAIKTLTLLAEFYERKAGHARTEPVKLIVETIDKGRFQGEEPWAK